MPCRISGSIFVLCLPIVPPAYTLLIVPALTQFSEPKMSPDIAKCSPRYRDELSPPIENPTSLDGLNRKCDQIKTKAYTTGFPILCSHPQRTGTQGIRSPNCYNHFHSQIGLPRDNSKHISSRYKIKSSSVNRHPTHEKDYMKSSGDNCNNVPSNLLFLFLMFCITSETGPSTPGFEAKLILNRRNLNNHMSEECNHKINLAFAEVVL